MVTGLLTTKFDLIISLYPFPSLTSFQCKYLKFYARLQRCNGTRFILRHYSYTCKHLTYLFVYPKSFTSGTSRAFANCLADATNLQNSGSTSEIANRKSNNRICYSNLTTRERKFYMLQLFCSSGRAESVVAF